MIARFQADADFNQKIVRGMRRREALIDFLDAHEGGVIGVPDFEVLRIAAESGRILVRTTAKRCRGTLPVFRKTARSLVQRRAIFGFHIFKPYRAAA